MSEQKNNGVLCLPRYQKKTTVCFLKGFSLKKGEHDRRFDVSVFKDEYGISQTIFGKAAEKEPHTETASPSATGKTEAAVDRVKPVSAESPIGGLLPNQYLVKESQVKKFTRWATYLMVAIVLLLGAQVASAQEASGTCAGVTVTGTQETVNAAMARLGCTYVAPQTPSGIGQDNTCLVTVGAGYTSANVRSGPGTSYSLAGTVAKDARLEVLGHNPSGTWTKFKFNGGEGWIYSPLCEMVPTTIETQPRTCQAYLRSDGFQMDKANDKNGVEYDVTIISTAPINANGSRNLCWPYRVIQDGAGSSIINDLLPQPPGSRVDAPEYVDFTFLANDWQGVKYVYYSGIAGRLLWDPDKAGPRGLEPVLDVNGKTVEFSENGTQFFEVAPYVGGWMSWQCVRNCAEHWGFRLDRQPWTRP